MARGWPDLRPTVCRMSTVCPASWLPIRPALMRMKNVLQAMRALIKMFFMITQLLTSFAPDHFGDKLSKVNYINRKIG